MQYFGRIREPPRDCLAGKRLSYAGLSLVENFHFFLAIVDQKCHDLLNSILHFGHSAHTTGLSFGLDPSPHCRIHGRCSGVFQPLYCSFMASILNSGQLDDCNLLNGLHTRGKSLAFSSENLEATDIKSLTI